MSLVLPNLDDRRWSDLVEQGRALIPLYAPEWTDHNASDPGITLMELLAWVTETDIYRLNRLTARQQRRLLALLNVRPLPPRPGTIVAELHLENGSDPVALPRGLEFVGTRLDGSVTTLTSTTAIDVIDARLTAVLRKDRNGFQNATAAWLRQEVLPLFGADPSPGAELYLGFDRSWPAHVWGQLFWQIEGEAARPEERRRLLAEGDLSTLPPHDSARLAWEYLAEAGGTWRALDIDDHTRCFTLTGITRLRTRGPMQATALGHASQGLYWIRCRLASGAFDAAPRAARVLLNGIELLESSAATQSWPIAAGTVVATPLNAGETTGLAFQMRSGFLVSLAVDPAPDGPRFVVLGYTAASANASGSLEVEAQLVGIGTGEPEQGLTLPRRPVVESTLRLFTREGERWVAWTRVDDFAASRRADAHYLLDATSGDLAFGDGEHGRVLPAGCLVVACYDAMSSGSPVGRLEGIADSVRNRVLLSDPGVIARVSCGAPVEIEASTEAETLAHAIGRGIVAREATTRAVTAADFEIIARETPGVRVARAIARPNLYPGLACVQAPGVVTLIVLPSLPLAAPVPSAGMLRRVTQRLEQRRVIGTRIVVAGPRYLEVAVRAVVQGVEGTDKKRLAGAVSDAIDAFLHPLHGGPQQQGWPLGRDVYRAEMMQVIDETPGVDHVVSLALIVEGCAPNCGDVCLRPTWLVAAGRHEIEVR